MGNMFQRVNKMETHQSEHSNSNKNQVDEQSEVVDNSNAIKENMESDPNPIVNKIKIDSKELKKRLTPIQYEVTQNKGTEHPFSGEYNDHQEPGQYLCVVCEQKLFTSDSKFPTHCGWPGFKKPISEQNVQLNLDTTHNMVRTEVTCSACDAHLGHVFDDGPYPERTRYCINSAALKFIKKLPK